MSMCQTRARRLGSPTRHKNTVTTLALNHHSKHKQNQVGKKKQKKTEQKNKQNSNFLFQDVNMARLPTQLDLTSKKKKKNTGTFWTPSHGTIACCCRDSSDKCFLGVISSYTNGVISCLTSSSSFESNNTTQEHSCSQSMRQKSVTVEVRGCCVTMKACSCL